MPKTSKATAGNVVDLGVLEERSEDLGGYLAGFTTFSRGRGRDSASSRGCRTTAVRATTGATCSGGRSRSGTPTMTRSTRQATRTTPRRATSRWSKADTEIVEFSPAEEYAKTLEVIARNMAAAPVG